MSAASILLRGLMLRCPHCGKGRIFRLLFTARHSCEACGRVYQRDPGDWTGGAEMLILLAFPFGILLLFAVMAWTDLSPAAEVAVVMGTMALVLPLAYRHVKGFWLGILRLWEGPNPQPNPLREPKWFRDLWDSRLR